MTSESEPQDHYEKVLADLRAKRDQFDQAITVIEAIRSGGSAPSSQPASPAGIVETAGMFLGMSIVDATKKLLAMRKRTMGNVEIARELASGGLVLTSKEPVNTIGSVITRRFNEVGDIVKVGRGIWGLKEWYPGRSFKPSTAGRNLGAISAERQATEQFTELGDNLSDFQSGPPDEADLG